MDSPPDLHMTFPAKPSAKRTAHLLWLWLPWRQGSNRLRRITLDGVLKGVILTSFAAGVGWSEYALFSRFLFVLGQVPLGYSLALPRLLSIVGSFLFAFLTYSSLLTAFSAFYLADDLPILLAAPIRRSAVLIAKWFETAVRSGSTLVLLAVPPMAAAGRFFSLGAAFYGTYFLALISLASLAVSLGVIAAMLLMRCFPAKRLHQTIAIMGLSLMVFLIAALRFLHLETLWGDNPSTSPLMQYLHNDSQGWLDYAPGAWFAQTITPMLINKKGSASFLALGAGAAFASLLLVLLFGRLFYMAGWWKSHESNDPSVRGAGSASGMRWLWKPGSRAFWIMMWKDWLILRRDPSVWTQLFMMPPLAALYLLNLAFLPRESKELAPFLAAANVGLIGLIVSAVGARFLFPAASREGRAAWIPRVSPASSWQIVLEKSLFSLPPVMALSLLLLTLSGWILHLNLRLYAWCVGYGFILALQLSVMAVSLGFVYPRFQYRHLLEVSLGKGAFFYMILALSQTGSLVYLALRSLWESPDALIPFGDIRLLLWLAGWSVASGYCFYWGKKKAAELE